MLKKITITKDTHPELHAAIDRLYTSTDIGLDFDVDEFLIDTENNVLYLLPAMKKPITFIHGGSLEAKLALEKLKNETEGGEM